MRPIQADKRLNLARGELRKLQYSAPVFRVASAGPTPEDLGAAAEEETEAEAAAAAHSGGSGEQPLHRTASYCLSCNPYAILMKSF